MATPHSATGSALVGRDRELAVLRDRLAAALAGQGSLVLIGGEAGVGKTALSDALLHQAIEQGARVLTGRAYDLSETPPYGPWVELFATYTAAPDLPAPFAQRGTIGAVESQAALFAAVQEFFTALATHQPLLLLLDDLHWVDHASRDLLRFLARTLAQLPVLVLVTYRVDELTRRHPLYQLLPVLERESAALRLDLPRLFPDAVRSLIAARYPLSPAALVSFVDYLHGRAEGNAFFTIQLLRALEEGGVLRPNASGGWEVSDLARVRVPLALRQVIDGRLTRLSEEAQRLLATAAVIGQDVPFALWATVTESDEERLLEVVEQAMEARIVEASEDGQQVRFVHALIREALYEGISAVRRRRMHARVGETLMALPAPDPDAVVYHLRRAGDARLAEWLIAAAERALRVYAEATVIARYEEALPLLATAGASPARYTALYHLSLLQRWLPDGIAYAEEALAVAQSLSDLLLEAVALSRLGMNRTYVESIAAGLEEQERAVAMWPTLAETETHWFIAHSTQFYGSSWFRTRKNTEGSVAHTQAVLGRFADHGGDGNTTDGDYNGLLARTIRDSTLGQLAEARAHLQPIHARTRATGDYRNLGAFLAAELHYVTIPYFADNAGEVKRVAEVAMTAWEQVGEETLRVSPRIVGMLALTLHGEWDEAWSLLAAVQRIHTTVGVGAHEASLILFRGRRETKRAWEWVRAMFPAGPATEPGDVPFLRALAVQETAAALALDAADMDTARSWLEAHDRWLAWNGAVRGQSEGQALWAQYHRQAGDAKTALAHAERALAHPTAPRQPLALLAAHRLLGELLTDARRFEDAASHLAASLMIAEACAAPYECALTLLAQVELHAAQGESARALPLLDAVRALCAPLRAELALARADALATRLATTPKTPRTYPGGLSERETEVLRLVAGGKTNAEIAEGLYLSMRTIEQHLRNVYAKLDVPSRAAAAVFAVQHGLA